MKRITLVAIAAAMVLMLALVACGTPAATPAATPTLPSTPPTLLTPPTRPTHTSTPPTPPTPPTTPTFLAKWGSFGTGNGQFDRPWGVAVDASGNVYVADSHNYRIQVFTPGKAP